MKKSVLLNQLKEAVSREEYEKLMTDTISDISQYNRRTMLEIMDSTEAPEGEVSSDQIAALKNTLKAYLGTYMADHPESWKWIILPCIYLCFVCLLPLHPQEADALYHKAGGRYYVVLLSYERRRAGKCLSFLRVPEAGITPR